MLIDDLRAYKWLVIEINRLEAEIHAIEDGGEVRGASCTYSAFPDRRLLEELYEVLINQRNKDAVTINHVNQYIQSIKDPLTRQMIIMRYVDNLDEKKTAAILNYDCNSIHKRITRELRKNPNGE